MQNFPTVGLIDGTFRAGLEETGMGYGLEVEMIRAARELDLLTAPYVFTEDEARAMAEAGADVLVPHMGLTTGGAIGAETALTLDEAVERVQALGDAARAVNPEILCLCHGGPIAEPDDARHVLERTTGIVGFFGASSMERLPTEVAMTENMRRFKSIPIQESSMSGRFITRGDIVRDTFGLGRDRLGQPPVVHRLDRPVRHGRHARARRRPSVPPPPRPGGDHLGARRPDRAVARAGQARARARRGGVSSPPTWSTPPSRSATSRPSSA